MIGLATLIDVLAVVVGAEVGCLFRGKLRVRYQDIILRVSGLVMLTVAAMGVFDSLFIFGPGQLEVTGWVLILLSLLIGFVLGDSFNVEDGLSTLGRFIQHLIRRDKPDKKPSPKPAASYVRNEEPKTQEAEEVTPTGKSQTEGKSQAAGKRKRRSLNELPVYNMPSERSGHRFVDGFVMATLFMCMNAMTIRGAAADVAGDPKLLYIKAAVDGVLALALAMVYGSGVCYAATPLAICQVLATVAIHFFPTFFDDKLVRQLAVIGGVVAVAVGIDLAFEKKFKAANVLPAGAIPILYYLVNVLTQLFTNGKS